MSALDIINANGQDYDIMSPEVVSDYVEKIGTICKNPNGYTKGSLFLARDAQNVERMYKATSAIASNQTITSGTNCTVKKLGDLFNDVDSDVSQVKQALSDEITARQNGDSTLDGRIDSEATARTNEDRILASSISAEIGARQSADANLQTQIDALIAPSGQAPSAAEVENARIGVDRSYSSLGDAIREQHGDTIDNLIEDNVYDLFCDFPFPTHNRYLGVEAIASGSTYTFDGTATGDINMNLYADSSAFIPNFQKGYYYHLEIEGTLPSGATLRFLSYKNGEWTDQREYASSSYFALSADDISTGMLFRWRINSGTNMTGVVIKLKLVTTNPNNPVIKASSSNATNYAIEWALNKFGKAIIGKGVHLIDSPITMPNGTIITGYGSGSVLKIASDMDGIVVGSNCTIENVAIEGTYSKTDDELYAGIKISKNYDTPPLIYETKLANLKISKMGTGILGEKTGYWTGCSISAVNVEIFNCHRGIFLYKHCEFARFTNINSHDNDRGIENCSGNNKFVNCSFSNNRINCYLDGWISEGGDEGENNGHGCFVGCDFNHADNNSGISILVKWVKTNGFIFDGCNIWYGRVEIDEGSTGITISDCLFGGGTPAINIWGNSVLILHDNLFKQTPTIQKSSGTTLVNYNNYLFDGTAVPTS